VAYPFAHLSTVDSISPLCKPETKKSATYLDYTILVYIKQVHLGTFFQE